MGVLPAHAGMVPGGNDEPLPDHRAPRARGDGPFECPTPAAWKRCSPRTRGWSRHDIGQARGRRVLPAHAGMVPPVPVTPVTSTCAPRARGDGPGNAQSSPITVRCSPRTRGWSPSRPSVARGRPVLPAHAGMVPTRTEIPDDRPECSPRTRGWSLLVAVEAEVAEVLPAHAGMVLRPRAMGAAAGGAPRARGDGPSPPTASHPKATCSPRTRGWSRPGRRSPMTDQSAPRARGDGPDQDGDPR